MIVCTIWGSNCEALGRSDCGSVCRSIFCCHWGTSYWTFWRTHGHNNCESWGSLFCNLWTPAFRSSFGTRSMAVMETPARTHCGTDCWSDSGAISGRDCRTLYDSSWTDYGSVFGTVSTDDWGVFSGTFGVMLSRAFSELVRRLLRRLLRGLIVGLIVGVILGLFMGEIVGLRLGRLLIGVLDLFLRPMVENGAMNSSSLNSLISSASSHWSESFLFFLKPFSTRHSPRPQHAPPY